MKITDHALLRYLQREKGVDVDKHRRDIEEQLDRDGARQLIEFAGDTSCKVIVGNLVFCLRNRTLTTCYPKKERSRIDQVR